MEHHDPRERLELHLPITAASVSLGRRAAAQFAEEVGCRDDTLWRVRLAVSEALSNAVLHAYAPDDAPYGELTLEAHTNGTQVVIAVADHGSGMRSRTDSPGVGLGLSLIAKSCDELELETDADGGTVVRMIFHR